MPTLVAKEVCKTFAPHVPLRSTASSVGAARVSGNTIYDEVGAFYVPRSAADQGILREIWTACLDDACVRVVRPENQVRGIINALFSPCADNGSVSRRRVLTSHDR